MSCISSTYKNAREALEYCHAGVSVLRTLSLLEGYIPKKVNVLGNKKKKEIKKGNVHDRKKTSIRSVPLTVRSVSVLRF